MRIIRSILHTALVGTAILMSSQIARAAEQSTASYGDLYLVEERQTPRTTFSFSARSGYEFSNSFLNVIPATFTFDYRFMPYALVGLRGTKYFTFEHNLSPTLKAALAQDTKKLVRPDYSLYTPVSIIPLSGSMNLFSVSAVPVDLVISTGPGAVFYDSKKTYFAWLWEVGVEVGVTSNVGIRIHVGQEIEGVFSKDTIFRTSGGLGVVFGI